MRSLVITALVFLMNTGFGVSVRIAGDDGWGANIVFEKPSQVKTPVFFILYDNKGMTNSEIMIRLSNEQYFPLDVPDGDYSYSIVDAAHKILLADKIVLKTPFRISLNRTFSDSAVIDIGADGRKTLEMSLYVTNRLIKSWKVESSGQTNIAIRDLLPTTLYRLEANSGGYGKKTGFFTQSRNAALDKPVFGTFNRLPESRYVDDTTPAITRVNDGKWEWYSGMAASGEVNGQDQFVYVNLEKPTRVRSVRTVWHAFYYPGSYYFVYGTDGRKWNSIKRNRKDFRETFAPDNSPVKLDSFKVDIEAWYVGIVINKGEQVFGKTPAKNYVELMELEVYE